MKIDRNAPCPCGSGKKYKKCCFEKIQYDTSIKGESYPEKIVVNGLIVSSKEFKTFYENERIKIIEPLRWVLDHFLPEGVRARVSTEINTGKIFFIRLPRIPPNLKDAFIIAHELGHIVLFTEGYSGVLYQDTKYENISASLGSMIHDLLVNSKLKMYGFDLLEEFNIEAEESKRNLLCYSVAPTDRLGQIKWIFNYCGKLLDWQFISGNESDKHEFHLWFEQRYPSIVDEAKNLLTLVKKLGYETPPKVTQLFNEIIRMYDLGNIMKVG
jgi:hypothetical protein